MGRARGREPEEGRRGRGCAVMPLCLVVTFLLILRTASLRSSSSSSSSSVKTSTMTATASVRGRLLTARGRLIAASSRQLQLAGQCGVIKIPRQCRSLGFELVIMMVARQAAVLLLLRITQQLPLLAV